MKNVYSIVKLSIIGCCLVVLSGCSAISDLAKEMGLAPFTRSEIQIVGVPDSEWAEQNGLSAEELVVYKGLRKAWLPALIKGKSSFNDFSLSKDRVAVVDASYSSTTSYYIALPSNAVERIIGRSTPFNDANALCLLTQDGFYFSEAKKELEKDDETLIQFIYYTALAKDSTEELVEQINKTGAFNAVPYSMEDSDAEYREVPWDVQHVKNVNQTRSALNRISELQALRETPEFTFADVKELLGLLEQHGTRGDKDTFIGQTTALLGFSQKICESSSQTNYSGDDLMFFLEKLDNYSWQFKGEQQAEMARANVELMAAKKGVAEAQYRYGRSLQSGTGVKRDKEEALDWFAKAAAQGHQKAISQLPAVSEADAVALIEKSEKHKGDTLVFKGFYLGMQIDDARMLLNYYFGKPTYNITLDESGKKVVLNPNGIVRVQADDNGNVVELNLNRTLLDMMFGTNGTPLKDFLQTFIGAYDISSLDHESVDLSAFSADYGNVSFASQPKWFHSSRKGFLLAFYGKPEVFNKDVYTAVAFSGQDAGQKEVGSMHLKKINAAKTSNFN